VRGVEIIIVRFLSFLNNGIFLSRTNTLSLQCLCFCAEPTGHPPPIYIYIYNIYSSNKTEELLRIIHRIRPSLHMGTQAQGVVRTSQKKKKCSCAVFKISFLSLWSHYSIGLLFHV